jgi:nitrite reductase/ring-hydroxylating ferredoxin subunit
VKQVDVGALDDFQEGRATIVKADGREIGVVRWAGSIYAIRNICPHQSAPLCEGRVEPRILAKPTVGVIELDREDLVLSCPWHGWEFELTSGRSVFDPDYRVRTYEVEVRDGRVLVEMGGPRG